jgi:hypothetical protein
MLQMSLLLLPVDVQTRRRKLDSTLPSDKASRNLKDPAVDEKNKKYERRKDKGQRRGHVALWNNQRPSVDSQWAK